MAQAIQRRARLANFSQTVEIAGYVPDPIIDLIVGTHLSHLTEENIDKIRYAHRLAMSAENVLGLLLEEYLAEEMIDLGGTAPGARRFGA